MSPILSRGRAGRAALPLVVFSFTALAAASTARADVPPPPGYVEQCTVEQQQGADALCEACGTYYAEAQKCVQQYASTPFSKRCQTAGASVWTEVWCRPRTPADPAVPGATPTPPPSPTPPPAVAPPTPAPAPPAAAATASDESASCAVARPGRGGRTGRAAWLGLGALAAVLGLRRRRATR